MSYYIYQNGSTTWTRERTRLAALIRAECILSKQGLGWNEGTTYIDCVCIEWKRASFNGVHRWGWKTDVEGRKFFDVNIDYVIKHVLEILDKK